MISVQYKPFANSNFVVPIRSEFKSVINENSILKTKKIVITYPSKLQISWEIINFSASGILNFYIVVDLDNYINDIGVLSLITINRLFGYSEFRIRCKRVKNYESIMRYINTLSNKSFCKMRKRIYGEKFFEGNKKLLIELLDMQYLN